MIKRSKNREQKPDYDDIVNDIEQEVETLQVEQDIVDQLPELKKLSSAIDKATTAVINAQLTLESAIRQTHREEGKLGEAVLIISNKVDSINQNIDKVLDDAPTKLKVSVTVSDADWQKINQLFAEQREWTINENRKCFREINDMLAKERKDVQKRYKEYDGCYLGYYAQWFFWFFFVLGIVIFGFVIFLTVDTHYHWTK